MNLSEIEEDFKKKLRRYFPNMDSHSLLVEGSIARLQFMNYTISVGLAESHDPKMLLFAKAAEMLDLLYSASRKRISAEDQKRQLEFRESCTRQQINRSQSASVEDKVTFMREEKESFKKLKTRCGDSGDIVGSHISLQTSKDVPKDDPSVSLVTTSDSPAQSQKSGAIGKESSQKESSPSQKDIPDTSYMKKVMERSKDQPHGFISVVRSFSTYYRILPPEFEIVRENDVFRCTAIFLGINFVSSYEYDKLDSKNDSCKKIVEYIVRNWKGIFQCEQYCFQ